MLATVQVCDVRLICSIWAVWNDYKASLWPPTYGFAGLLIHGALMTIRPRKHQTGSWCHVVNRELNPCQLLRFQTFNLKDKRFPKTWKYDHIEKKKLWYVTFSYQQRKHHTTLLLFSGMFTNCCLSVALRCTGSDNISTLETKRMAAKG